MRLKENFEEMEQWIVSSGIQNGDGSFNSWYDLEDKNYPYKYSEITGYGITTLLFLYNLSKNDALLKKAEEATGWIRDKALHPCGGVLTRDYKTGKGNYSFESQNIFSFDTSMVMNGLCNLYITTKKEEFLSLAKKMADFLINKMQREDGTFYAIYDVKNNQLIDSNEKWSTQSGSFHSKIAIGLINLYFITKNEIYKESAFKICKASLRFIQDDGRFISNNENETNLHPHSYSIEGLLFAGLLFKEEEFIGNARKAIIWSFTNQLSNGGIASSSSAKNTKDTNERSDVLAQTLRLALILLDRNLISSSYMGDTERLLARLLKFQFFGDDMNAKGGVKYSMNPPTCINSWCTMFALQALMMYQQKMIDNKEVSMDFFI